MSEHEPTEVGAKLVLDEHATEALKKVAEGFEHVKERLHETAHEMLAMTKQAAEFAIGFQLSSMIDSVKEFGEEIVHNAIALEDENKELAGVLAMVDKGHTSFEGLRDKAGELNDKLENLGMTTGNTKAAMLDAFEMIAEKTTGSAEHVEEMVGKMAEAAKTLPGGIASLSGAWRDLESGIVRPRNALVQLMRQMGVVEGTSKQVANALSVMVQHGEQEKVFAYAEEAVERMAKRTKEMPLTFGQMLQSMSTFRESLFETAGTPIINSLRAEFGTLNVYLTEHRDEIEKIAHTIGVRVGEWVTRAARLIQEGFEFLKSHSDDILNALEKGAAAIKDAVAFMVEHRTLLLALATAHFVGPSLGGGARALAGALPGLGQAGGQMLGGAMAGGGAGFAAIGAALPAAAAAAASWAVAADQASKLEKESGLSTFQTIEQLDEMLMGFDGSLAKTSDAVLNANASLKKFTEEAPKVEAATTDLEHYIDMMERSGQAAVAAGAMTEDAFDKVMENARRQLEVHAQLEDAMNRFQNAGMQTFGLGMAMPNIAAAYKEAADQNTAAADAAARRILAGNEALTIALGAMPNNIEDALMRLKALAEGKTEEGAKLPPINFGPSTFVMHQDFRDVDPDRIAIVFRKDVAKNAISRIGAKTGGVFGF